ncbi:MAG: hypothetical protein MKZ93_05730 [Prochlorococcus sp. ALOHA_A2.0_51]|nr:hypothetical protein [Prochlorococcus sp. ALOHA_A2.0_51]
MFRLVQQSRIFCGSGKRGFAIAMIYIRAPAGIEFGLIITVLSFEHGITLPFSMFGFGALLMLSRAFLGSTILARVKALH